MKNKQKAGLEYLVTMMRTAIIIMIIGLAMITLSSPANAIGISPSTINLEAIAGGYASAKALISDIPFTELNKSNFKIVGEHADWFEIELKENNFITIKANIPPDAENKIYYSQLIISYSKSNFNNNTKTNFNVIDLNLKISITLTVSGDAKTSCYVGGVRIPKIEKNDLLTIKLLGYNSGNVRVTPKGSMIIKEQKTQNQVYYGTFTTKEILPTEEENLIINKYINIEPGVYLATIYFDNCKQEIKKEFEVLNVGSLNESGKIISFKTTNNVTTGDIINLLAKFKNTGEKTVKAKLSGVIEKDNKIIKVIDGEELLITKGENINLNSYFIPEEAGKYLFKGTVKYNDKETDKIEQTIVVRNDLNNSLLTTLLNKSTITSLENIKTLTSFLIIVFLTILIVLIIIKKKKKKKKGRTKKKKKKKN